jgi:uncharacterized membrane protein YhhN
VSILPFAIVTAAAVALLLVAQARDWETVAGVAKGIASSAFVAAALASRATASPYGRLLLVALSLSWLGDLLLLSRERRAFLAGLGAFLAAHVAFVIAFALRGVDWKALALAAVPLALFAFAVSRWLLPHVDGSMRAPVIAYMTALCTMVAFATGAAWGGAAGGGVHWRPLAIAAVAFLLSDLAVARDHFVAPGIWNQAWGLPLYYAAQLAFASSAATAAVTSGGAGSIPS